MTTTASPAAHPGAPTRALADLVTVTGRNLHRLVRVPTLIVFATVQPVMFVLLFTYTYGGAIHPPGVAIADDLATGMIDRFRALPMARSAVLAGRALADAVRNLFVLA